MSVIITIMNVNMTTWYIAIALFLLTTASCLNVFAQIGTFTEKSLPAIQCVFHYYATSDHDAYTRCMTEHNAVLSDMPIAPLPLASAEQLEKMKRIDFGLVKLTSKLIEEVLRSGDTSSVDLDLNHFSTPDTEEFIPATLIGLQSVRCTCDYMIDRDLNKCKDCFVNISSDFRDHVDESITEENMEEVYKWFKIANDTKMTALKDHGVYV